MPEGYRGRLFTVSDVLLAIVILWIPVETMTYQRGVQEAFVFTGLWMGMLFTAAMYSRRTTGNPVTLFPVFQAFLVVGGHTLVLEAGLALAAFLGCLAYGVRTGAGTRRNLLDSTRFLLVSLLSVRAASWLIQPHRGELLAGYPQATAGMTTAVVLVVLLNSLGRMLVEMPPPRRIPGELLSAVRSTVYPVLVAAFVVPAVLENARMPAAGWPWTVPACTVAVIALQTIVSLLLDRARFTHSRSLFLESEIGSHTRVLSAMETPLEALRKLASFWCRSASPEAVRVTWRNTSILCPTSAGLPPGTPLTLRGGAGLLMEIWSTPLTPMDSERLDIFITQTETVLLNLEMRQRVGREGWECLEAMVSSLDITDLRRAGYSKRVAGIARRLGRRMGLPVGELDDLEMAAMLHLTAFMLERAEEDWEAEFSNQPREAHFELPPEVLRGIRHLPENFDGSGKPEGLRGPEIPRLSRILAVACAFATGLESRSEESALQEIHHRSGSIYDPAVVSVLDGLLADDEGGVAEGAAGRRTGGRHPA